MKLKGKIALITGAGSGIGKATAVLFAKEGAFVVLTGRDGAKLSLVKQEIGKDADYFVMDVIDREQVNGTISKTIKKYKKIDILVNNAGIAIWNSIENATYKEFDDQINVNLNGYFNCIKETVPYMVKEKSGCIVNVITSTVKRTKANRTAYAASKYGQAGLSNAVHEDLKDKGISVIAIYPGKTDTPIHDPYIGKDSEERKKLLRPEMVAEIILKAALIPVSEDVKELVAW